MKGLFEGLGRPPREPSQGARTMAGMVHEHYTAFMEAGFTEKQAMDLIKAMIAGASNVEDDESP